MAIEQTEQLETGPDPENEIPQTQAIEPPEMITIERAQLSALLSRNQDFETMVTKSVEIALLLQNTFGGKFPTSLPDALAMLPRLWKNISKNPHFILQLESRITAIRAIAPKYLPPETIARLEKPFETEIKKLTNGNRK